MKHKINLRHILAAIDTMKLGNISAAAEKNYLSQSAVTQALNKLEQTLDEKLFQRMSRGVIPTDSGKIFLDRLDAACDQLKDVESLIINETKNTKSLYRLFTLPQLLAFSTVVTTESMTRAALKLGLAQPTVHRAINDFEVLCSCRFFQRSPVGLEPNKLAVQISRRVDVFFREVDQAFEVLDELKGSMAGSLNVGCLPLVRTKIVPDALNQLLGEYPEIKVGIVDGPYEEQLTALLHGKIDIIIGALRPVTPSADVKQVKLFEDTLSIVVRHDHPLKNKRSLDPEALKKLDWIAPRLDTPARDRFNELFTSHNMEPPRHVIECSSLMAIRGLLMDSDRASLLSSKQVTVDVEHGLLAVLPQYLESTRRDIGYTIRKGWQPTQIQKSFIHLLANT